MGKAREKYNKPKQSRAVAYIRVSTDDQALGVDAQKELIAQYATANGVRITRLVVDVGTSGGLPLSQRTLLLEAVDAVKIDKAGLLLVAKWDRLSRDTSVAALIEAQVAKCRARIVSADGVGAGDTIEAKLLRHMVQGIAEFERGMIRQRTKAALKAKKERGECVGQIPYGMRTDEHGKLWTDGRELLVIERIRKLRAEGKTQRAIVDILNASNAPCRGKQWYLRTVQRILERE